MQIRTLGTESLQALALFARDPAVVRFGDHLEISPPRIWRSWLGDDNPERQTTIGVFDGESLRAAGRLLMHARRRACHTARIELVAPFAGGDHAVHLILEVLVDAADRWMQVSRLELRAPAEHPRIDGVYARHGFVPEVRSRRSIVRDGSLCDEVGLARVKPQILEAKPLSYEIPPTPRGGETPEYSIRPLTVEDARAWTRIQSAESVVRGTLQLPHQREAWWAGRIERGDPDEILALGLDVGGVIVGGSVLVLQTGPRRRHCGGLAMMVAPELQGRGLGRVILDETLKLADGIGLRRVELGVFDGNVRARALYEASGFVSEGVKRRAFYRDGVLVDGVPMARLI